MIQPGSNGDREQRRDERKYTDKTNYTTNKYEQTNEQIEKHMNGSDISHNMSSS